jgi:acetate kinase
VHGGTRYRAPVRIDDDVIATLKELIPLARIHEPHQLDVMLALTADRPELPQVACFDTAFHHTQPEIAQWFALPRELTDAGIRRYGFHGLSYEYIAEVLPQHLGAQAGGRVIVAHLGNGASMCAMKQRRSIATTMGLTALDGLVMGTRCGAIDPGVLLYLIEERGLTAAEVSELLYERSGLLGVSGISHDMRTLLASDDARAAQAVELFVYHAARAAGSLAAALHGLDALVFTGGIGEHSAPVRAAISRRLQWLGIELDDTANDHAGPRISTARSRVGVWVIPTNEEQVIAHHTRRVLGVGAE